MHIKIFGKEILSVSRNAENPQYPLTSKTLAELFTGDSKTGSGINVTEEKALAISAVYNAVRIISETIAVLPLQKFRRTAKGKELMKDDPMYFMLHDQPNNYQDSFIWRETATGHQCLWGNHYSKIDRDPIGRIRQLLPYNPSKDSVEPVYDPKRNKIFYVINNDEVIDQANMLHFKSFSFDGVKGKSPIRIARESMGLAMALEQHAGQFFGSGAQMDVVIKHPQKLGDDAHKHLKDSFNSTHRASGKRTTAILEEGMSIDKLSVAPEEAQFLQSRKFSVTDVARWFRLPPHMLADLEKSSFSNIEQMDIGFVKYSMAPWLKRQEQEYTRKLLTEDERKDCFYEYNLDGLLRGDVKTRAYYYQTMRTIGALNANEIREMENRNHREDEGGNSFENPNTTAGGKPAAAPADDAPVKE